MVNAFYRMRSGSEDAIHANLAALVHAGGRHHMLLLLLSTALMLMCWAGWHPTAVAMHCWGLEVVNHMQGHHPAALQVAAQEQGSKLTVNFLG
jgi:hypothetical protein